MCGICGIIDYNTNNCIDEDILHRMCSTMKHRGPDDEGIYIGYNVGLGHRRLKIIDLSDAGHQPMCNEDETIWIVFNGEIYNFQELRKDLEIQGHRFKSHSDTEVIVHLYEQEGIDCVHRLRGMFAFTLWDARAKVLFMARDRVGKKPLLYYHNRGVFCFASEFQALLASNLIDKEINPEAINYYLSFGYIAAPLTIYKEVFKLPPAHRLILKENNLTVDRYWQLDYDNKIKISEEDAQSEVLRLLKEAVKIRLHSDVPLGAFLSGGIDSSTVVALMSEFLDKKVKTFSIGFQESDYNELGYARNIADRFQTQHSEFIVRPNALEILPLLVERYGEPYADSSCVPTYYVSREARNLVAVALNGDGGDESFVGYERYQAMLIAEVYRKNPKILRKIIFNIARCLPDSLSPRNRLKNIKRFLLVADQATEQRYLRWVGIFDSNLKNTLYSQSFKESILEGGPLNLLSDYLHKSKGLKLLDRLLMADVNLYLPYDLLVKVDIASMANSLEVRCPFLDHKLMEFVARLPVGYKMKRLIKKYLLKKAIKDLVPRDNIHRRKMGFGVPVDSWFRNDLKGFLKKTVLSKTALKRGYFNPEVVRGMVNSHIDGKKDYTISLWVLLMLELWHNRFID